MSRSTCSRRLLAANDFVLVEQCSCGSVHVTIGAVTLRLASAAIPELATVLGDAVHALVRSSAVPSSATRDELVS